MMLSYRRNGARLRPSLAFIGMQGEPNFVADRQFIEAIAGNGVAMKVDLGAIGGRNEAVVSFGDESRDPAMGRNLVRLDIASAATDMVLQLPPHRVEAVLDGDIDVFMCVVLGRIAFHHDLLAGNLEVDPDVIEISVLSTIGPLDDHSTAHDSIEEALQLFGAFANPGLDRRRGVEISERNLKPSRHGVLHKLADACSRISPEVGLS
jgi:hypothetical protein